MSNLITEVQIHLTIHQEGADLKIDFPFNTQTDDINQVVAELVETCKLTQDESVELKQMIQKQIANTLGSAQSSATSSQKGLQRVNSPPNGIIQPTPAPQQNSDFSTLSNFVPVDNPIQNSQFSDSDDADVANDPEYKALLNQQRNELMTVERRHEAERKDLIAKLQRGASFPTQQPAACNDLIMFE